MSSSVNPEEVLKEAGPSKGEDSDQLIKAYFVGEAASDSESKVIVEPDKAQSLFSTSGALVPLYDPAGLATVYENSSCLRSNVDAYITNVDSFGHQLVQTVDLDLADADTRIRNAIVMERRAAKQAVLLELSPEGSKKEPTPEQKKIISMADVPTPAEIAERKEELRTAISEEKAFLELFFENCTVDMPFNGPEGLRGLTRMNLEVVGNGYWEIMRDGFGQIAQFNRVPAESVRLMPVDKDFTEVEILVRVSPLSWQKKKVKKRFRRFVQSWEGNTEVVYFKEFGDPRVISAKTGAIFKTQAELQKAEGAAGPVKVATELFWFKITSLRSPYGAPRWIGTLLAVLGNRQAEEGNFIYFENRSVPPLAVLVSGGRLHADSVKHLEEHIRNNIKGARNNHKILILEAEPATSVGTVVGASGGGTPARMKIEIVPLSDSQLKDALFQQYDERNFDKVGQAFRLPRLLRGDVRDFNRSCYSEDTETLTENGWKTHDQIADGEKIAAFNKDTGEVVFVVPEKKLVYDVVDETMWHFHNSKTDCLVTGDHRMLSRPANSPDAPWTTSTADSMPFSRFFVPVAASSWAGEQDKKEFFLPKSSSCQIRRGHDHAKPLLFDDWLEFLGYFVSEGGLVMTDHPAADYLVYIDQKKLVAREKMRACFDRLGWKYSTQIKPCGTTHFLFSNRCLKEWIVNNLGTNSYNWKLPVEYLRLNNRQLKILFDAMMLGDGTWDTRPRRDSGAYYSCSKVLASQMQEICLKSGLAAHLHFSEGEHYTQNGGIWRCCFSSTLVTRLSKIGSSEQPACVETQKYTGKVYCFSVPGYGYFVTRRDGKVAFQGNTAAASIDFAEVQVFGPIRQQFDWILNKQIMPAIGARYHVFRSNAPTVRDPEALSQMIDRMVKANVLTPGEGRALCSAVFNQEFPVIDSAWTKQPFSMTAAGWPVEDDLKTDENETERYPIVRPTLAGAAGGGDNKPDDKKDDKKKVKKDGDEDEDDDDETEDEEGSSNRRASRASQALLKIHKCYQDAEMRTLSRVMGQMERQVIRIPEAEMRKILNKG